MDWQRNFDAQTLRNGRQYYTSGLVRDLMQVKPGEYHALVLGTQQYDVIVKAGSQGMSTYFCNCPWANNGHMCKHMAAVRFAIDDRETGDLRTDEVCSLPIDEPRPQEARTFDPAVITRDMTFSRRNLSEAEELIREQPDRFEYEIGAGHNDLVLDGTFRFYEKSYYDFGEDAGIRVSTDAVAYYWCDRCDLDSRFSRNPLPCPHVTALLLHMQDAVVEDRVRRILNRECDDLVNMILADESPRQTCVRARISLFYENARLIGELRVGKDRLLIEREPEHLLHAIRCRTTHKISSQSLDFAAEAPDAPSTRLLDLFLSNDAWPTSRYFEIPVSMLDDLFALLKEEPELLKTDVKDCVTELLDKRLQPGVTIRDNLDKTGRFIGQTLTLRIPSLIYGQKHLYYVRAKKLYRTDPAQYDQLLRYSYYTERRAAETLFTTERLGDLHETVLPYLQTFCRVKNESRQDIAAYLPTPRTDRIYLDLEDGRPSARFVTIIDDREFPVTDEAAAAALPGTLAAGKRTAKILQKIRSLFPEASLRPGVFTAPDHAKTVNALLDGGLEMLMSLCETQATAAFERYVTRRKLRVTAGVRINAGRIELEVASPDVPTEELADILAAYREKKKYHRLHSGILAELDDTIDALDDLLLSLGVSPAELVKGKLNLPGYRAFYLDAMSRESRIEWDRDAAFDALIETRQQSAESLFTIPAQLSGTLREYQIRGCSWIASLAHAGFGGILADEMGLGKTLQAIAVIDDAKKRFGPAPNLIVCPASLVYNWQAEFARFAPELDVRVIAGSQFDRADMLTDAQKKDVLITSYDLLKRDVDQYERFRFRYEFIDEAQFIKNHNTAAARSVKLIAADHRFALTGTPIENRLSELWSIFDYLMPGFLFGYETFRKQLEIPIIRDGDARVKARLVRLISPFILRRLKQDVLTDLPEKLEEIRYAGMGEKQRLLYDAQTAKTVGLLTESDGSGSSKIRILADLMRLRQICCSPELIYEDYTGGSAKLDVCVDLIRSAIEGEHRILLFSQFTSMLDLIKERLDREQIPYYTITGSTPKRERVRLVERFNSDETPVFLISLKAGGTGLNLTGADTVIHYDPWWNIAVQEQATDRAHRIGQQKVVTVYKLIMLGTIEERILRLQQDKQALARDLLSEADGDLSAISKEDLLALLRP